jgi:transposase
MKVKPYLKKFKKSDMLIIMEHTGVYHLKLANYLYENDYKVAVVNPFSIKKFMEAKMTRVKTDKADSYFIENTEEHFSIESFINQNQM